MLIALRQVQQPLRGSLRSRHPQDLRCTGIKGLRAVFVKVDRPSGDKANGMALRIENHSQAVHCDLRKLSGWNAQDRRNGMVKDVE